MMNLFETHAEKKKILSYYGLEKVYDAVPL